MKTLMWTLCVLLGAQAVQARPTERHELTPAPGTVDVVGDVDNTQPPPSKAANDTIWIATWNFEGCDDTGWVRADNRILNDGNVYWSVSGNYSGLANIVGDAAACGTHNLCFEIPDCYGDDWYQGICIHYVGDSFLSFDYVVDSEGGFDFLQVETDSACASFGRVDYNVAPGGAAFSYRDVLWAASGYDTVTARVDSLSLSGYGSADTHCVYISFVSDFAYSPCDGLPPGGGLGVAAVVDNVLLEGAMPTSEDFTNFVPSDEFSFVNLHDNTPFGAWARTFQHITDNDLCTENLTCSWLATDHTSPTFAKDPSMNFGPGGYVIKNWLDETLVGPWVSLSSTSTAIGTTMQFRRFPGNTFSTSRIVQNWSIRGRSRIANSDTPAAGDSLDCISEWGHASQWNSLSSFEWRTMSWDATDDFHPSSSHVQVRFRVSDWQWIAGAAPPSPFNPGPGPFWDRVRIGRHVLTGPVIDEGIDARYQAQDAAPNDPSSPAPVYAQLTGPNDIFGTTAFSMANDICNRSSPRLIVGDSITVDVEDVLGHGGLTVEVYASIVAGPHEGKSPAPFSVGGSGFFVIPAEQSRTRTGQIIADRYFVDLDDTYFRGGDMLRYFWWATDQQGGVASNPSGLTAVPADVVAAELATGGLFEVNFLPTINWDPTYLGRIAADTHGDLDPTAGELANSQQANCILYENNNVAQRRRSGDLNRTSFMYTLDKLGYRNAYDVFDHVDFGNNNQLGSRMSPEQGRNYSIVITDTGNRSAGGVLLSDGSHGEFEKIDMNQWFQDWLNLSGGGNPPHTLWFISSDALEEHPFATLYQNAMAVTFAAADQAQDSNPNVFGIADFTTDTACLEVHTGALFALNGGCPVLRDYDDIRPTGTGVQTHVYGKDGPSAAGAIVMNANAAGYTTIMQSFAWSDLRTSIGQPPAQPDEVLLDTVLQCAVASSCWGGPPTNAGDGGGAEIAIPAHTALHQNTPNPFNPMTTIRFDLAHDARVSLRIYDVAGRLVRVLSNELMTAGYNRQVTWNGLDTAGNRVSSGVYFYRLVAGETTATRKLVVMK